MYLTDVKVLNAWNKLEDLIKEKNEDFVFDSAKTYTIQNIGSGTLSLIESETQPVDIAGFFKRANEKPFYYKKTNGDLYVRSSSINTFLAISED